MSTTDTTKRDTYWDTVKALLIFLVIFGHVIQFFMYHGEQDEELWSDAIFKGIYLFHMPLFMLISGYFAAKSIVKYAWKAIPRYLLRLVVPCLSMGALFVIISLLKGSSVITGFHIGSHLLWFLIVVFECVLCYLIMQQHSAWWYRIVTFILPIPLAILAGSTPETSLFWPHQQQFTYLWPIFVLGTAMSTFKFNHNHINWKWSGFFMLFIPIYFIFDSTWYVYRYPLDFTAHSFCINIFRTAAAITGCGAALWAIKYLHPLVSKFAIVRNIGQATLALYVLQTLFFGKDELFVLYLPERMSYLFAFFLGLILLYILYALYCATRLIAFVSLLMYGEQRIAR